MSTSYIERYCAVCEKETPHKAEIISGFGFRRTEYTCEYCNVTKFEKTTRPQDNKKAKTVKKKRRKKPWYDG